MKITAEQVRYVAGLANLRLSEEEVRRFSTDLGEILAYMDKLNELDTSAVAPMAQVLYEAEETSVWREDRERPVLGAEAALANAPVGGGGFFKVPRVIER